jgi:hypothetical protein
VPIRRSWEIPIAWSTWSKKDLSSEKSSISRYTIRLLESQLPF